MHKLLLASSLALLTACAGGSVRIAAHSTMIGTSDGDHVWSYQLHRSDTQPEFPSDPRAVVFYVAGSGYERSVLSVTGAMAGFVIMGMPTILLERRGIEPDGMAAVVRARRHGDKRTRVADALAALRAHLGPGARPPPPLPREYAGLDHGFQDEAGRSKRNLVERDVVDWLRDQGLLETTKADRLLAR